MGSCNSDQIADICSRHFPEYMRNTQAALARMDSIPERNRSAEAMERSLASQDPVADSASLDDTKIQNTGDLTEEEKEYWQDWAQANLKRMQATIDLFEEKPEWRQYQSELNRAANDLVILFSYTNVGDLKKMKERLRFVQTRLDKIHLEVCAKN